MVGTEITEEKLEGTMIGMTDGWFAHLEEHPRLHVYPAASLISSGVVAVEEKTGKEA